MNLYFSLKMLEQAQLQFLVENCRRRKSMHPIKSEGLAHTTEGTVPTVGKSSFALCGLPSSQALSQGCKIVQPLSPPGPIRGPQNLVRNDPCGARQKILREVRNVSIRRLLILLRDGTGHPDQRRVRPI